LSKLGVVCRVGSVISGIICAVSVGALAISFSSGSIGFGDVLSSEWLYSSIVWFIALAGFQVLRPKKVVSDASVKSSEKKSKDAPSEGFGCDTLLPGSKLMLVGELTWSDGNRIVFADGCPADFEVKGNSLGWLKLVAKSSEGQKKKDDEESIFENV